MPAANGCDERWPLFHFWRHNLWPKLASLKFCPRKRSLQWYPDRSDWINWAWSQTYMHEISQNLEWKTRKKFPLNAIGYSLIRNVRLDDAFSGILQWNGSKPSRRSTTAVKRKEKEKKERRNRNFDFCAFPTKNVVKRGAREMKGTLSCCECLFE